MKKLNKFELEKELHQLWENRESFSQKELSQKCDQIYSNFEMTIEDLINHLTQIKKDYGNIKVLKEDLHSGTLHLVNIHVQQRNDNNNDWTLSIY